MNLSKPIGGYFELELRKGELFHTGAINLNSGRNCFEYILRHNSVSHVFLPKYICDAMFEPLKKLGIPYTFYSVNQQMEIAENISLNKSQFLVYVNYAGIKDTYCKELQNKYKGQLILDCSQAFYFKAQKDTHIFYSPRKFFGVADGGCLYSTDRSLEKLKNDTTYQRADYLLKRIDLGAEKAYSDFRASEESIKNLPIMQMSQLTKAILMNIDYKATSEIRTENFMYLHRHLKDINRMSFDDLSFACPMYYPYLTSSNILRETLISKKIFVPTYWPNVLDLCENTEIEYNLADRLIPIPIDQRYNRDDMDSIIEIIQNA